MLEREHLISLIVLVILIIAIILWLYLTIRSIRFQKRIENYVVVNEDFQNISILDRLCNYWNKVVDDLVKKLKQMKIDKSLYKVDEKIEISQKMKVLAIKILLCICLMIIYLLFSLFRVTNFSFVNIILVFLLSYYIPEIVYAIKNKIRKKQIENDLLKAVSLMNNSFQSGKSIIQTIKTVVSELDGPLAEEFDKMHQDMLHGLSFQTAFIRFNDRVDLDEVKYITTALLILNKTGGNIMEVFASIERSFYTRRTLDMELKATIASSKLVFQLLVFLPIFLWGIIGLWNPDYFSIFFESTPGVLLFTVILCIYLIYIIVIRNIMKVEKY